MADAKPYSDEQIEIITGVLMSMPTIDYRRFLATIAEYKEALDSAMRQVSSLNLGNIADGKRIADQAATIWKMRGLIERWEKGFRGASVVDGVYRISAEMIADLLEQARNALDGKE